MHLSELLSWIGSAVALGAFLQGILPAEYSDYISDTLGRVLSPYTYFVVPEFEGCNVNELYIALQSYLSNVTASRARVSNLTMSKNAKKLTFSPANNQRILDSFNNVRVEWMHKSQERKTGLWAINVDGNSLESRSFHLKMHQTNKEYLSDAYFSHIIARAKEIERGNRDLQLFSNKRNDPTGRVWNSIPFLHPASFDTVALDRELKHKILTDLDEFANGEEFYRSVGKAWKRGYLLFGPPGTGKSSVIAAMANKLHYDVYDLELTEVESNADLRKLLLHTSNKSIVVIEDIDCSLDLSGQRKKEQEQDVTSAEPPLKPPSDKNKTSRVTLSGLLNFTDGLWSSCGSERIFIFTTNFVKKLDPALLRPGRMDMHIKLDYCKFHAFKTLAKNFLHIKDHELYVQVEREIETSFVTPAEVSEVLTRYKHDSDVALEKVLIALRERKTDPQSREDDVESVTVPPLEKEEVESCTVDA